MYDFSVFGNSFNDCLKKLEFVLERCIKCSLTLSWEKSHVMVVEVMVLGHVVSKQGLRLIKQRLNL